MNFGEWLEEKRADYLDWPLTWKLGMIVLGVLGGWLFAHAMGPAWSAPHCMFVGGVLGLSFPFLVLNFIELTFGIAMFALIFGAIYWAFRDTEGMQEAAQFTRSFLGMCWDSVKFLFGKMFG